jgi:hypothetical protein
MNESSLVLTVAPLGDDDDVVSHWRVYTCRHGDRPSLTTDDRALVSECARRLSLRPHMSLASTVCAVSRRHCTVSTDGGRKCRQASRQAGVRERLVQFYLALADGWMLYWPNNVVEVHTFLQAAHFQCCDLRSGSKDDCSRPGEWAREIASRPRRCCPGRPAVRVTSRIDA